MAAQVVGAFSIIDRASRPIKNIRQEAVKADVAVAKLGDSLDRVGSQQQRKQLDAVSGNMRKIAKEGGTAQYATKGLNSELDKAGSPKKAQGIERAARAVKSTGTEADSTERSMKRLESTSNKTQSTLDKLGKKVLTAGIAMKAAMVPAVGLAVQGVGALAVGVGALLPQLTSFSALMAPMGAGILGVGAAMLTVKLATDGLSKALGGNKAALKALTPEAREFVRTLKQYKPLLKELQSSAQRGLFPGLDLAIRRLATAAPVVKSILRDMGATVGGIASSGAAWATRGGFLRDLEMLTGQGGTLLTRGSTILMNLGDSLRHVFVAAMPFTDWLSKTVVGWSDWLKGVSLAGRETGHLAQWFRQARTDLEQFGRIGQNVWGAMTSTLKQLRPLGDLMWGSIEKVTDSWNKWSQSARGQGDMRTYFAQMAPSLRQIAGFAGDLGASLGRLSQGTGFTASVRALRQALPSLEGGLNAMAEGLGPSVVAALSSVVTLFGTLGQSGGALTQVVHLIGGIASSFNWIFQHVPAIGTIIATALSVSALSRFGTLLGSLAGKWRQVGTAATVAGVQQETATVAASGGGVGGVLPVAVGGSRLARAGSRIRGFRPSTGGLATVGAIGATVAGQAVGGGLGNALSGAGTGAVIGATVGSAFPVIGTAVGAAVGAVGGGAIGFLTGRSASRKDAVATGQDQALTLLAGGANAKTIGGRIGDIQSRLSEKRVISAGTGSPIMGQAQGVNAITTNAVTGSERKRLQAQLDALKPALKVQVQIEREQAVRAAQDAGARIATELGQAFNVYNRKYGLNKSMQLVREDTMHQLRSLGPVGRRQLAENTVEWAKQQADDNPKLTKQYHRLTDRIVSEFQELGQSIQIVNGTILDGSKKDWDRISSALTDPVEKAREKVSAAFTGMQREAVTALTMSGFSRSDATGIVRGLEAGGGSGTRANNALTLGSSKVAGLEAQNAKNAGLARGGRIPGSGLYDTVPVAPGVMAAPQELIVNRHTERRVDEKLAAFGTSLGREVSGESRPHYAALGARVTAADRASVTGGQQGGGLHTGIQAGVNAVLAQFPGLSITSTTGGGHAANSYHYRGMAADLGGAPAVMNQAAAWIGSTMGRSLLEGIHNPNLSVKNGQNVPSSLWGSTVWGQHLNHIHMAMNDDGPTTLGSAGGSALGGGLAIKLKKRKTGVGGVGGAAGDQILENSRQALMARINDSLAGGSGGAGTGGAISGGGSANSNRRLAKARMIAFGWGGGEWGALNNLWTRESNFNDMAVNKSSGAAGIAQSLGHGAVQLGNPLAQINWGLGYIKDRYGSPAAAWAHEQSAGWYAKGGRVPDWGGWHARGGRKTYDRPTLIGVGENGSEDVSITPRGRGGSGGGVTLNIHAGAIVVQGAGKNAHDIADEVMARIVTIIKGMGMESEGAIS